MPAEDITWTTLLKIVEKVWGEEIWLVNNDKYCGKILNLKKGYQCSRHYHPIKDETFYIQSGRVRFELWGIIFTMLPGDKCRILPGQIHRFLGLEDSTIIEISTHHDDDDVVRLEESGKVF